MRSTLFACLMCLVTSASAFAQAPWRGWVNVNAVSLDSPQGQQDYGAGGQSTTLGLPIAMDTVYPALPTGGGFDVDAGIYVGSRGVGLGARFERARYQHPVSVGVTTSHPFFLNLVATDDAVTANELGRSEVAVDLMLTWDVPLRLPVSVRVFGGPTYFNVSQEMVANIEFLRSFNFNGTINTVEITNTIQEETDGNSWGYNVGADVSYFFSRYIGVGGVVRMNRGTVDVRIPLVNFGLVESGLDVGHVAVGGGVRVRF